MITELKQDASFLDGFWNDLGYMNAKFGRLIGNCKQINVQHIPTKYSLEPKTTNQWTDELELDDSRWEKAQYDAMISVDDFGQGDCDE